MILRRLLFVLVLVLVPAAVSDAQLQADPDLDGYVYDYEVLRIRFATRHPDLPLIESLYGLSTQLLETEDGFIAPRDAEGLVGRSVSLGELVGMRDRTISTSAVNLVAATIVREFQRRGISGVLVAPDPDQIDPATAEDLRDFEDPEFRLLIWVGVVADMRTIASGRISGPEGIDNEAHARIKKYSPVRPDSGAPGERRKDLIRRSLLDEYVLRLNRHPGRRVDISIAASGEPGATPEQVTLDYLVNESRPWNLFAQYSNSGSESTSEWRQRYGFTHNQLTDSDDVLRVDYITSAFNTDAFRDTNTLILSYERPVPRLDAVRARAYGSYSEYLAGDVGGQGQDFSGQTFTGGGELILTVYQRGNLFIDLVGGGKAERIRVRSVVGGTVNSDASTDFLYVYGGVRLNRSNQVSSVFADLNLERTLNALISNDTSKLDDLGRFRTDPNWITFTWDTGFSVYVDPWLNGQAWSDPSTPGSSTLAHELVFGFRGQYPFSDRLIPQKQAVVGGGSSVRGYPESVSAGDISLVGSAEYRLHVPRLLAVRDEPSQLPLLGRFRVRPQQAYGSPDWDLILAAFVDAARVQVTDPESTENDEDLVSAGLGVEVSLRQNFTARADFGFALDTTSDGLVSEGDTQVHITVTLLF